jgi:hypothetical protein
VLATSLIQLKPSAFSGRAALAKAYEILLGKDILDAIDAISRINEELGLALMKVMVEAKLGELPASQAKAEIDQLVDEYRKQHSSSP